MKILEQLNWDFLMSHCFQSPNQFFFSCQGNFQLANIWNLPSSYVTLIPFPRRDKTNLNNQICNFTLPSTVRVTAFIIWIEYCIKEQNLKLNHSPDKKKDYEKI